MRLVRCLTTECNGSFRKHPSFVLDVVEKKAPHVFPIPQKKTPRRLVQITRHAQFRARFFSERRNLGDLYITARETSRPDPLRFVLLQLQLP